MHRKIFAALALAGIATLALAATIAPLRISINGKAVPGKTTTVDGETYVPLSALKAAGASASVKNGVLAITFVPGGTNQVGGLEGKVGDWLFDGVWRFRVLSVAPTDDRPGWKVQVELRNGTKFDQLALDGSGFDSLSLIMADGNALKAYNTVDLASVGVGQGSMVKVDLIFYDDEGAGRKPDRLILRIQPDAATNAYLKANGAIYATKDPSFRVKLSE